MIDAGKDTPCDIFYGVPSCIPATPLEAAGATIGLQEFLRLRENPMSLCLGEVMSYVQLVREDGTPLHELLAGVREKCQRTVVEGHCPNFSGLDLATFMYYGPDSDHTQQTVALIDERIKIGMMVELQEKSLSPEVLQHIERAGYDEHICLVTDDVSPDHLVKKGHLDHLIRMLVQGGVSPERALYWTTYTPARRMRLDDRGAIAPGRLADFVLLEDLETFKIWRVYKAGKMVHPGEPGEVPEARFPAHFYRSIDLPALSVSDFVLDAAGHSGDVTCRGMVSNPKSMFTEEVLLRLPVRDGHIQWEGSGWALAAVFNRYGVANRGYGLIRGATMHRGAIATSYAHDSHNLLVLGHNARDIEMAARRVIEMQGGISIVNEGVILAEVSLPIAGLMADAPVPLMAERLASITGALVSLGYDHVAPLMSVATITLAVSPALKLTDFGLVDVLGKRVVPLIVD
jgi:adenine deaminase